MYILGICGNFYRSSADAAAVLLKDGRVIAAAEEERFTRVKHAPSQMPEEAIRFCLAKAQIKIDDIDILAFPQTTWKDIEVNLREFFQTCFGGVPKAIEYVDHHLAHAASAYRFSGYENSMILTADWTGDGVATTLSVGEKGEIKQLKRLPSPDQSLGVFYGVMTQYLGFKKWEDEYKVMGLASYGKPEMDFSWMLPDSPNGSFFSVNRSYLHETLLRPYPSLHGLQQPGFSAALEEKLGPARIPRSAITEHHKTVAASAQKRLEEVVGRMVRWMNAETGFTNLCIAGGVGLNCSMNGALLEMDCVDNLYVPPVANDSGLALGAAAEVAWKHGIRVERMEHAYYGPEYKSDEIRMVLDRAKLKYEERPDDVVDFIARELTQGKIIGWFQGAMEFGPRALGNRSILGDPRQKDMKDRINYFVKFREDFRPLAPSMLEETANDVLCRPHPCPFMTITFDVKPEKRSMIPAVTHVDGTARVQTVTKVNGRYHDLISRFGELTGVPCVLNTSMNVMGDPMTMKPVDALATFFATGLDHLAIGDFVISK